MTYPRPLLDGHGGEYNAPKMGCPVSDSGFVVTDMAGFTPMADILAAVHVRSHVRMFMN